LDELENKKQQQELKQNEKSSPELEITSVLAYLIAIIWGFVTLASVFTAQYTTLEAVTPVMLTVAGFLFGYRRH
jgi:hypothetical protein